jgi:hypothetical protein
MVGILYRRHRDRERPPSPRHPPPERIRDLCLADPRVLNLIHYSAEKGEENSFVTDMVKLHALAGENLDGFQLNMAWPRADLVRGYRELGFTEQALILQISSASVSSAGGTPKGVANALEPYAPDINGILFDLSGGHGRPLDTQRAKEFLSAIADRGWNLGLGSAGGLGPYTLDCLAPLVEQFPGLSCDAEKELHDEKNEMNINRTRLYRDRALQLFS